MQVFVARGSVAGTVKNTVVRPGGGILGNVWQKRINTIRDIGKIEAGRMDIVNYRFQPRALIEAVITTTQPLVHNGVDLTHEIESDLPQIISDQLIITKRLNYDA
jgi:hypothetical protein